MNSSIFLDTTVFFHSIEHDRFGTVLEHANNAGFKIHTSISVLGEAFTLMHKGRDAVRYITHLNHLLDEALSKFQVILQIFWACTIV